MHVAFFGHIHVDQHLFGLLVDVTLSLDHAESIQFECTVAAGKTRDHHVFHHRQVAKNLWRLENPADAHLVDLVWKAAQHGLPVEHDRACIRHQLSDKAVEQGRFAGPVRADDGMNGVFRNRQVHVVQGLQTAEAFADPFDFKDTHEFVSLFCGVDA